MPLPSEVEDTLRNFIMNSSFSTLGAIITDLDGTAVHEDKGRIYIPSEVELGLKEIYDFGCPLILNTIRFPLSVIRTFGRDWYGISNAPIPTVSLNGSQLGFVIKNESNELSFEEIESFPLTSSEIDVVLTGVKDLILGGIKNILLFYYPRDWRMGEIIWTPVPDYLQQVKEKYTSASSVTAIEFVKLREQLLEEELCMIFLLVNVAEDQLMAYQHSKRSNFFTHKGVNKLSGTHAIAEKLGVDLTQSIAAGDTEMDLFLKGAGLSVLVGNNNLSYRGIKETLMIKNSFELGELFFKVSQILKEMAN